MKLFLLLFFALPSYGQQVPVNSLRAIYYAPEQSISKNLKASGYKFVSKEHDSQNEYTMYLYQGLSNGSQIAVTYWDSNLRRTVEYFVGEQEYDSKLQSLLTTKKPSLKYSGKSSSIHEFVYSPLKIAFNKSLFTVDKKRSIICVISIEPEID